jgi:hypothetical protein
MKSMKRLLLLITVASGALHGTAWAQVPTLPPDGGFILDGPGCATMNAERQPATNFRAGDELILTGSSFPAQSSVLATFQQAPHSSEVGRFTTNDSGEFTSEPSVVRIPGDATDGPAAIKVSSSGGSADCELVIKAAAVETQPVIAVDAREAADDSAPEGTNPWLIVWGTIVAIFGAFLGWVTYRRWQAERLEQAMARIGRSSRPRPEPQPAQPDPEAQSPPILEPGWDEGREPTPIRPE